MKFNIWVLVYSPVTNENIVKLAYFSKSTDLETFVKNSSIKIITFEQVVFNCEICVKGGI